MKHIDNYGRFYGLLKRLPGADKETLVRQFTGGRTEHLRQMSYKEYELMCKEMERVSGYDERHAALLQALKKARSGVLHQMQLWGVNTADWKAVDAFCKDKRIAGKVFRELDTEDLNALNAKIRAMRRKTEEGRVKSDK